MHRRSGAKILGGKSFVGTVDGGGGGVEPQNSHSYTFPL